MAKSCLFAAICASFRRSARTVSAFSASRVSSQGSVPFLSSSPSYSNYDGPSHFYFTGREIVRSTTRLMSTAASSTETKVIKRVKTVHATPSEEIVAIKGWVRTVRKQKTLAFVEVNDGSSLAGIQCVLPFDDIDETSNNGTIFL